MQAPETVSDALGNTRPVIDSWPDGSYSCPWCASAVTPEHSPHFPQCENPGCPAGYWMRPDLLREQYAKREAQEAEEARRKANHEWAMRRIREENEARDIRIREAVAHAREIGACVPCLLRDRYRLEYGAPRFVKHRKACPLAARE